MTPAEIIRAFLSGASIDSLLASPYPSPVHERDLIEMLLRGYALGLQAAHHRSDEDGE